MSVVIEKQGTLPSGEYFVTFNVMGNRCGYVEVGSKTFKLLYSEHLERYERIMGDSFSNMMGASRRFKRNNLSRQIASLYVDRLTVHGGVTYVGELKDITWQGVKTLDNLDVITGYNTDKNVVGFDCGHYCDGFDKKAYKKYFPNDKKLFNEIANSKKGEIRTAEYVEEQCKLLESQLRGKEQLWERIDKSRKAKDWRGTKRTKRTCK